ncbi:class I SAM-dependent methyltransferase [Stieleria sp. ICT_E10.1]|uniref:class I SAM-dependent methyltransferase n=1 Tax=Stieleria sedimenti TaxID=2976331 RepID=UPI00217F7E21|nr:class I SAM-dependent methyltransferase [Stieleria sedimenti]MCS7465779.1 class I SAM-dependent methyltransferase [Stieleria sedimenti]
MIKYMSYQDAIYASYRSAFKGDADANALAFNADKLQPVIEPWVTPLSRDSVVMDLGCGAGELLLAFRNLGFRNLCGCDLSEEQVALARTITSQVATENLFDFLNDREDHSVDVVTLFDVFEHLTRQETFDLLGIIGRKLRPGGLVIGHVPNGLSPFAGHVFYGDPTHQWCPTPSAMRTMLSVTRFVDFAAAEHLGNSKSIQGRMRSLAWKFQRFIFATANLVETGCRGEGIWTRNFAFKATTPGN